MDRWMDGWMARLFSSRWNEAIIRVLDAVQWRQDEFGGLEGWSGGGPYVVVV